MSAKAHRGSDNCPAGVAIEPERAAGARVRVTLTLIDRGRPPIRIRGFSSVDAAGFFVPCSRRVPIGTRAGARFELLDDPHHLAFGAVAIVERCIAASGLLCRFVDIGPRGRAILGTLRSEAAGGDPREGRAVPPPLPADAAVQPPPPPLPLDALRPPRSSPRPRARVRTPAGEICMGAAAWVPDRLWRR